MIKNKSFGIRIVLATMMALTVAVTGCKDDGGGGGTAGSGGTGGVGGIDVSCDKGRCVDVDQATKCEEDILACIAFEPANEQACIAFGNFLLCSEGGTGGTGGTGGSGGTAGSGGMGGEGGSGGGIDISCDEGRCVDPTVATECKEAITLCIAAEPANEEKCIALGNLVFCNEDVLVPVFVTSVQYRGNFPGGMGLIGADASCTLAATNAGLSGNWTAWLSDSATDAINRIPDGEYLLFDGTLVADGKADLTDGMLESPIIVQETGSPIPGGSLEVWTATDTDGTRGDSQTCFNWTSTDVGDTAQSGRADATDATWTDEEAQTCDIFNRLYCFADATSN